MFVAYALSLRLAERQSRATAVDTLPPLLITKDYGTQDDAARLVSELNTKRSDYGVDAQSGERMAPTALASGSLDASGGELMLPHLDGNSDVPQEMSAQEIVLAQLSDMDLVLEVTGSHARRLLDDFATQHKLQYDIFMKLRDNENKRRHAINGTDPFSLEQSLEATFAYQQNPTANQLKKALRAVFAPLAELLDHVPARHHELFGVARRRQLIAVEWPQAIDTPARAIPARIDFDKQLYVQDSVAGAGSYARVKEVMTALATLEPLPSDTLLERLLGYCHEDPAASLRALELANDRAYYAASADVCAKMEAELATVWRALSMAWHEWSSLWTVLATRIHTQYIVGSSTEERQRKKDEHKQRLSTLAQWMTQRQPKAVTTQEAPYKALFDGVFAGRPSADDYLDGLSNDKLVAIAAFYRNAVVVAWSETARIYAQAKQSIDASVRRQYPGEDSTAEAKRQRYSARAAAVLRSSDRVLWRLVDAWVREVRELDPLRDAGAQALVDELLQKSSSGPASVSSSSSNNKQRLRSNCFRHDLMQRFWRAWLDTTASASEFAGVQSPTMSEIASLHSATSTVYAYAGVDMYEHTG